MKFCIIQSEIAGLNAEPVIKNRPLSEFKQAAEVLIIDADPFVYKQTFKKDEFMIDCKSEVQPLKEVEA